MKLYESLNNSLDRQLQTLIESSERLNEADNAVDTEEQKELKRALFDAYFSLQNKYETNIKAYEIAFQEAIEGLYPDKAWWEVTDCNIFMDLFETRDPWKTIMNIADKMIFDDPVENYDEVTSDVESDGFKEDDFVEQLKECLRRMNEEPISDEDKRDSDIIRNIIAKRQKRKNAAFTKEEKDILNKYGIIADDADLSVDGATINPKMDGVSTYSWRRTNDTKNNGDISKINYADRARKVAARKDTQVQKAYNDTPDSMYDTYANSRWVTNNRDLNAHVKTSFNTLDDARENALNRNLTYRHGNMHRALQDRKYHGRESSRIDLNYDNKEAALQAEHEKKMAELKRRREFDKKYHSDNLDTANNTINKLLNRSKDEALMEDFEHNPARTIQELAEVWGKYEPDYLYYVNSKSAGAIVPEDNVIENIDGKYVYVEGSSVQGNPNFLCTVRIPISEFDKYYTLAVAD